MSAEVLRQAAALMRDVRHSVYATDAEDGRNTPYVAEANNPLDAEHIASWHPAVALAVADWLEHEAAHFDMDDTTRERALAVARAYLGGAS